MELKTLIDRNAQRKVLITLANIYPYPITTQQYNELVKDIDEKIFNANTLRISQPKA